MSEYISIIHKKAKSDFGASFPDLPGSISAAKTLEELRPMIGESLGLHLVGMIEDGEVVPKPSSLDKIVKSKHYAEAVAVMVVKVPAVTDASVRINITLPQKNLGQH